MGWTSATLDAVKDHDDDLEVGWTSAALDAAEEITIDDATEEVTIDDATLPWPHFFYHGNSW